MAAVFRRQFHVHPGDPPVSFITAQALPDQPGHPGGNDMSVLITEGGQILAVAVELVVFIFILLVVHFHDFRSRYTGQTLSQQVQPFGRGPAAVHGQLQVDLIKVRQDGSRLRGPQAADQVPGPGQAYLFVRPAGRDLLIAAQKPRNSPVPGPVPADRVVGPAAITDLHGDDPGLLR